MRKSRFGEKPTSIIVPNKKINFENKNENLIFSGDNLEVFTSFAKQLSK